MKFTIEQWNLLTPISPQRKKEGKSIVVYCIDTIIAVFLTDH